MHRSVPALVVLPALAAALTACATPTLRRPPLAPRQSAGVIPSLTYTGTLTEHSLDADYTVTKADGAVVTSILRMTK